MQLSDQDYFVMGDNRNASSDSREWGALDKKFITGHVALRLLPINKYLLANKHYNFQEAFTNSNNEYIQSVIRSFINPF